MGIWKKWGIAGRLRKGYDDGDGNFVPAPVEPKPQRYQIRAMVKKDRTSIVAVRRLIRGADRAMVATIAAKTGWPYASLSMMACDHAGAPLVLMSGLAEHAKNIAGDSRASLLIDGTAGLDNPLTGGRVTVLGRFEKCADAAMRARYLRRYPDAAIYADFADFCLYRMTVERAHLVAGFGEVRWMEARELLFDASAAAGLVAAEGDIVDHMNADHARAVDSYAGRLLGLEGAGWEMVGLDPEGCDCAAAASWRGSISTVRWPIPRPRGRRSSVSPRRPGGTMKP